MQHSLVNNINSTQYEEDNNSSKKEVENGNCCENYIMSDAFQKTFVIRICHDLKIKEGPDKLSPLF